MLAGGRGYAHPIPAQSGAVIKPRGGCNQVATATVGTITGCPYRSLIAGILERAVQDARGRCNPVPSRTRAARLQDEARAWLTTSRDVEVLLELGGYESAVILQRVQQVLGG